MAGNNNDSSSIFWSGVAAAGILYFLTESLSLACVVGLVIMLLTWVLKGAGKNVQQTQDTVKAYSFDFDALNPMYKSQLLKQQFSYFLKYRTTSSNEQEFYCAEDQLDGYRFSFWIEYLVDNSSSHRIVQVNKGAQLCNVYIMSNKGKAYGYEKFTINAPVKGVVTNFLKGSLQKDLVIFRIKEDKAVEIVVEKIETVRIQVVPAEQSAVFFEDVVEDILMEDENIEVEKLEDVLRWDMSDVEDIEMPDDEEENSAYDVSVLYHATITNLSDFDWCNFRAVCYLSTDDTQKEVKRIGNVKIGTKALLSSRYDMFYLEGEDINGEQKRFRPFTLEKDSDITITTIFAERG